MENDKLKDIFSGFQPELSSSIQFMSKVRQNLEAIEIVKKYTIAQKKRTRTAVVIAALCGFATGVIFTLLFPLIRNWLSTIKFSIFNIQISDLTIDYDIIGWIIMISVSILTTLSVYEISLAKFTPKDNPLIK